MLDYAQVDELREEFFPILLRSTTVSVPAVTLCNPPPQQAPPPNVLASRKD